MVFVVVNLSVFYLIFVFITNYYWTGDDAGHQLAQAGHPVEPAKLLADPRQSSASGTTLFRLNVLIVLSCSSKNSFIFL